MGVLLPLSNDMIAALPADEQTSFMPLFLLNVLINMIVLFITLTRLRYRGWKLFLATTVTFFGLFGVLNAIELIWRVLPPPLSAVRSRC
jgi:prolipoprotein diacylglyceryltransferase